MAKIAEALQVIHERIAMSARNASRDPEAVMLLAVSKGVSAQAVCEAMYAGQNEFGENYVQEAVDKIEKIRSMGLDLLPFWHFIGPIQSNKTRLIATYFDWVHSINNEKNAQRLSMQRPDEASPLNVCIQVNIDHEPTKGGVAPEQVVLLAKQVMQLPRLRLRGLMIIPSVQDTFEQQRVSFRLARQILERCCAEGIFLDTLSMGMSLDYPAAITEGATIVRIGTSIFGSRGSAKV